MRNLVRINRRLALIFAIFLAVFSTGMVIAHQCHSVTSNQTTLQHSHSDLDSAATTAAKPLNVNSNSEGLVDSGCAVLLIAVLLFGRKLLDLRTLKSRINRLKTLSRDFVTSYRPQVFQLSLSRPQLGVIRI